METRVEHVHGKLQSLDVDKFDGKGDFGLWKHKVMCQLELLELEVVLEDSSAESSKSDKAVEGVERKVDPKFEQKDRRVKNLLKMSLSDAILRKVMKEPTALDIWRALERDYQSKTLPNRIFLKQRFTGFKMDESKSIEDNLDTFQKLVDDLASLNIQISDEDQAIQLLTSLPPPYEPLVHTLKYGSGKDTLTVAAVTTSAYSKEAELNEKGLLNKQKSQSEGLYVESRGRTNKRPGRGGYKSSWKERSKSRGKSSSAHGSTQVGKGGCFICGKEGHWKRECRDKTTRKDVNAVNLAREPPPQPIVLTVSTQTSSREWVMDSGCSFHITPYKDSLFDLKEFDGGKVLMANDTQSEVKGIGKVKILNPDGSMVILNDVRYIPNMSRNLISYGMLEKAGCRYEGIGFLVQFYKGDKLVLTGKYEGGLYYLQGEVISGDANVSRKSVDMTEIWHSRLGHMSLNNMDILVKEGYMSKKEVNKLGFCESCVLGKSHKQSFPTARHTTKGILDYIHSDMWGSPSTHESLAGCRYFITFIDDFSRKVWIYFLTSKDQAFQKFKEWKDTVEAQTKKRIRYLRTDNGLEFCNSQFDNLCKESGIIRHKTCTYTPQQNGVSERMNRTIMDKMRCMLAETGLEQEFWAEAASTAVYLINRTPNSVIKFKLPEEVWSGSKPDLSHLRRFGCTAYVHKVQEKTKPRALKGVFLGYPFGVKGYRVWLSDIEKCETSRNMVFNEEELYKDTVKGSDQDKDGKSEQVRQTGKGVETDKKRNTRKVTFAEDLIHGPTPSDNEPSDDTEIHETSNEADDSDDTGRSEADSDTSEEEQSLDNYLLARDRKRRSNIRPPSKYEDGNFVAYALIVVEDFNTEEPRN